MPDKAFEQILAQGLSVCCRNWTVSFCINSIIEARCPLADCTQNDQRGPVGSHPLLTIFLICIAATCLKVVFRESSTATLNRLGRLPSACCTCSTCESSIVYSQLRQCCELSTARRIRSVVRRFGAFQVICSCSQWQAARHICTLLSSCSAVLRVIKSGLKQPCKTVHKVLKSILQRSPRRGLAVRGT